MEEAEKLRGRMRSCRRRLQRFMERVFRGGIMRCLHIIASANIIL
jgi:hypothetical protein